MKTADYFIYTLILFVFACTNPIKSDHNLPDESAESPVTVVIVDQILEKVKVFNRYKSHYFPSGNMLKIFVDGGSVTLNKTTGEGIIEFISRRPVFYQFNFLHYNNPKFLWTWFADIYAAGLVIMAFTGLWMIQGKRGFTGRGKWYVIAGILIPVFFLLFYL